MQLFLKNKLLTTILLLTFVVSLGYSLAYRITPLVDAQAYDAIARNLIDGCGFKEVCSEDFQFDAAIIRAGPGYEFFLAGIYALFGHHYEAVWAMQALLHTLSAGLLYIIARRLLPGEEGEMVGLVVAGIFGFWPDLIEINAMLLTETLYLFFVILTWYIFTLVAQTQRKIVLPIFLGVVVGLTILTRPPVILFVPIIAIYLLLRKEYRATTLFVSALAVSLLPWVLRNYGIYHQFILTTMIGQYNIWIGNRLGATGGQISDGVNPLTDYTSLYGFYGLPEKASHQFFYFITEYPVVFVKLCLIRFVRYFSLIRPMGFWFYQHGLKQLIFVAASGAWIASVFLTGFAGLARAAYERKGVWYAVALFALSAPLLLIPTVVESRYRFQIYPFIALGSAYTLVMWRKNKAHRLWVYSGAVILFGIALVDVSFFWSLVQDRLKLFF